MCFEYTTEIILGIFLPTSYLKQKNSRLSNREVGLSLVLVCMSAKRHRRSVVRSVLQKMCFFDTHYLTHNRQIDE